MANFPNLSKKMKGTVMNKKYELIDSDIPGLYRIKALKDFIDVKEGDALYLPPEERVSIW